MILEEKRITLKNGKTAILKTPCEEDAAMLLQCIKSACDETDFFERKSEDWDGISIESEEKRICDGRNSENSLVISCYIDEKVVGNCDINFRSGRKTFHRAAVGIAILKDYWNLGIGSAMFEELLNAAKEHEETELVELEFIEGNERSRALYEKFGFKIVSKTPNAYKLKDGTYQNKIYMQKYL